MHPGQPGDTNVPTGWTLCYIGPTDAVFYGYSCSNLLQGLTGVDNASGLLAAGGNFGCWNLLGYPDADMYQACRNNYQHAIKVSDCFGCTAMSVCIRYP